MMNMMRISVTSLLLVLGTFCSASLAAVVQRRTSDAETVTEVFGIYRAVLSCPMPQSTPQHVEWLSYPWSSSSDPILIARSSGNPDFDIETSHPNAANYYAIRQLNDYMLVIDNLNIEMDPGRYICRVTSSTGDQREHLYELTVLERSRCEASEEEVLPGGQSTLTCEVRVHGASRPKVQWFAPGGRELDIVDESNTTHAIYSATATLTIADNYRSFTCKVTLDDVGNYQAYHECRVDIRVLHCSETEVECEGPSPARMCIADWQLCNGVNSCGNNWDESPAACQPCRPGWFTCGPEASRRCVPESDMCDGFNRCGDWSDESPEICGHK